MLEFFNFFFQNATIGYSDLMCQNNQFLILLKFTIVVIFLEMFKCSKIEYFLKSVF